MEIALAAVFFYTFIVHIFTHKKTFIEPALFKDRNFTTGLFFIFMVSIIMLSTMALLPPFLQNLKGYPVLTTGYILAPRGIGTMFAMLVVGRLIITTDSRLLILIGIGLTSFSLWQMSNFNVYVPISDIVSTGVVQGVGLGFIFVPLSTVTFSTLAPERRTDGASIFSLVRNIGAGIGISVMVTLLAQSTQTSHAGIVDNLNPFRLPLQPPFLPQAWNWHMPSGAIALNAEATRQAATIAYLNDFTVMMWVTLLAAPLLLLLKKKRS